MIIIKVYFVNSQVDLMAGLRAKIFSDNVGKQQLEILSNDDTWTRSPWETRQLTLLRPRRSKDAWHESPYHQNSLSIIMLSQANVPAQARTSFFHVERFNYLIKPLDQKTSPHCRQEQGKRMWNFRTFHANLIWESSTELSAFKQIDSHRKLKPISNRFIPTSHLPFRV